MAGIVYAPALYLTLIMLATTYTIKTAVLTETTVHDELQVAVITQ